MKIKHEKAILKTIAELHHKSGWNAVYAYLKAAKIPHTIYLEEFGLENKTSLEQKQAWMKKAPKSCFRAHFCNRLVTSSKNRFQYNVVRAQQVQLLPF